MNVFHPGSVANRDTSPPPVTLPEHLRHDIEAGEHVQLILRSGHILQGRIESADLMCDVVRIDGWTVRIAEIAGVRASDAAVSARSPL